MFFLNCDYNVQLLCRLLIWAKFQNVINFLFTIILHIKKLHHGNTLGTQSSLAFNFIFLNPIFGEHHSNQGLNQLL